MPIPPHLLARVASILGDVDAELARRYPGDRDEGQPVHTVYVSAADASPDTPKEWGEAAVALLDRHGSVFAELDEEGLLPAVRDVLAERPIQDLRIDFEDGYGGRGDEVEDADATRAGTTLAALDGQLPSLGARLKGLTRGERVRTLRTFELLLDAAGGAPKGLVFTIPKIKAAEQVEAMVLVCEAMEAAHSMPDHTLRFELQIETPQAILGGDGTATVAKAIHKANGRCVGLHFGTYDYGAACGIAPQFQSLEHPVADHAKAVMMAAAAETGVWVADGSTQVLPVGTDEEVAEAIRWHHHLVTRSLERGYYQGWDMHPGHLVTRWLATFTFYRKAVRVALPRIERYLDRCGGPVRDEPATAQALAAVVLRGVDCGAFGERDLTDVVPAATVPVLKQLRRREDPTL